MEAQLSFDFTAPPMPPKPIVEDISAMLNADGIVAELYQLDDRFYDKNEDRIIQLIEFSGKEVFDCDDGYTETEITFHFKTENDDEFTIPYEDFDDVFHNQKMLPVDDEFAAYFETYFKQFHQQDFDDENDPKIEVKSPYGVNMKAYTEFLNETAKLQVYHSIIGVSDDGNVHRVGSNHEVFIFISKGKWKPVKEILTDGKETETSEKPKSD